MRSRAAFLGASVVVVLAAPAVAQAPSPPRGNFGGGALVAAPRDIFGAGNAIVALRALPERRLEIEATVRAGCAGGDVTAAAKIAPGGAFEAKGTETQEPSPTVRITTKYALSGHFTAADAAEGTIERSTEGRTRRCRTGSVGFGARRPVTPVGEPGAPRAARYYGTTSQRGVGPSRPIVLRISADGQRITRALFGESVRCSDGKLSIGVDAPRTNVRIDARGRVRDRERFDLTEGETVVHVDDRFTAQLGADGARGTLALSDRTTDRASGRTIQTCRSGTVRWRASR